MFLRLVADSFTRRPKRKMLTLAALALGMAVATAALSVSLDVGDRLAQEFRSLGANLLVTPEADSLPLEIGGVDYRPANAVAYLPEADLGKLKTIFWRFNIKAFAPIIEAQVKATPYDVDYFPDPPPGAAYTIIGTWVNHEVGIPDGTTYVTGIEKTNPWWQLKKGRWFREGKDECVVGKTFAIKKGKLVVPERPAELPLRDDLKPGDVLFVYKMKGQTPVRLHVVGVLDTGGPEDNAIIAPLEVAQTFAAKPGQYRRLYVSALTKPEDAFARKDPKTMTPAEFDRFANQPGVERDGCARDSPRGGRRGHDSDARAHAAVAGDLCGAAGGGARCGGLGGGFGDRAADGDWIDEGARSGVRAGGRAAGSGAIAGGGCRRGGRRRGPDS